LASSAGNWSLETRADEQPTPWAEKDMMIVLGEADRLRLSLPLSGVVKEVIKQLKIERGYPTPSAEENWAEET
jgi:3-hydroxyisobutyrate dehydrogenase/2-hydroxy-3-oxopropionate reductase